MGATGDASIVRRRSGLVKPRPWPAQTPGPDGLTRRRRERPETGRRDATGTALAVPAHPHPPTESVTQRLTQRIVVDPSHVPNLYPCQPAVRSAPCRRPVHDRVAVDPTTLRARGYVAGSHRAAAVDGRAAPRRRLTRCPSPSIPVPSARVVTPTPRRRYVSRPRHGGLAEPGPAGSAPQPHLGAQVPLA